MCGQNVEFANVNRGGTCSDHWALRGYIYYTRRSSPYCAENTLRLSYKNQSFNAV